MSKHKKSKKDLCRKPGKNKPGIGERMETMEREFHAFKEEVRMRLGDLPEPGVEVGTGCSGEP